MSLGSKIRAARRAKRLTQEDVAKRFSIQAPSVSEWENDKTRPELDRIPVLASIFGVSVEWLMSPTDEPLPIDHDSVTTPEPGGEKAKSVTARRGYPPELRKRAAETLTPIRNLGVKSNVGEHSPAPFLGEQPRDLPVRGTAICGEHERGDFRFNGETVDYLRRPPRMNGVQGAFAVYLIDDSMSPQFAHGDPAFIHPGQPVVPGDTVLIELHPEADGEAGAAMVKILVRRTGAKLKLSQHNPKTDIELDAKKVKNLYRVVPYRELFEI